ncbi:MAG: toll/interleukin-1 receptor domain-containing protein [Planctomycetota bacterium]
MPRVFISYSHDTPQHSARVLAFAQTLRNDGIDVELDQFHRETILDWPRWCSEQISREHSDFIICVSTAEYNRRIEGKVPAERGKGVHWEGTLLDDEMYDLKGNRRVIPVVLDDEPETSIPRFLRGWTFCRIREFDLEDDEYEKLIRIITSQRRITKAPIGSIPDLPPELQEKVEETRSTEDSDVLIARPAVPKTRSIPFVGFAFFLVALFCLSYFVNVWLERDPLAEDFEQYAALVESFDPTTAGRINEPTVEFQSLFHSDAVEGDRELATKMLDLLEPKLEEVNTLPRINEGCEDQVNQLIACIQSVTPEIIDESESIRNFRKHLPAFVASRKLDQTELRNKLANEAANEVQVSDNLETGESIHSTTVHFKAANERPPRIFGFAWRDKGNGQDKFYVVCIKPKATVVTDLYTLQRELAVVGDQRASQDAGDDYEVLLVRHKGSSSDHADVIVRRNIDCPQMSSLELNMTRQGEFSLRFRCDKSSPATEVFARVLDPEAFHPTDVLLFKENLPQIDTIEWGVRGKTESKLALPAETFDYVSQDDPRFVEAQWRKSINEQSDEKRKTLRSILQNQGMRDLRYGVLALNDFVELAGNDTTELGAIEVYLESLHRGRSELPQSLGALADYEQSRLLEYLDSGPNRTTLALTPESDLKRLETRLACQSEHSARWFETKAQIFLSRWANGHPVDSLIEEHAQLIDEAIGLDGKNRPYISASDLKILIEDYVSACMSRRDQERIQAAKENVLRWQSELRKSSNESVRVCGRLLTIQIAKLNLIDGAPSPESNRLRQLAESLEQAKLEHCDWAELCALRGLVSSGEVASGHYRQGTISSWWNAAPKHSLLDLHLGRLVPGLKLHLAKGTLHYFDRVRLEKSAILNMYLHNWLNERYPSETFEQSLQVSLNFYRALLPMDESPSMVANLDQMMELAKDLDLTISHAAFTTFQDSTVLGGGFRETARKFSEFDTKGHLPFHDAAVLRLQFLLFAICHRAAFQEVSSSEDSIWTRELKEEFGSTKVRQGLFEGMGQILKLFAVDAESSKTKYWSSATALFSGEKRFGSPEWKTVMARKDDLIEEDSKKNYEYGSALFYGMRCFQKACEGGKKRDLYLERSKGFLEHCQNVPGNDFYILIRSVAEKALARIREVQGTNRSE